MAHAAVLDADQQARSRDDELARLVARNDRLEAENEAAPFSREKRSATLGEEEEGPGPPTEGGRTGPLRRRST